MPDVMIRDVPEHIVSRIDANARRLGLSRSDYLRRQLAGEAVGGAVPASDLARFSKTYADLDDDELMGRSWR
jgi:hypothetical protein